MQAQKFINIGFADATDEHLSVPPTTDLFRENQLLTGVSDETYAQLEKKAELVEYGPREVIFRARRCR
jgi:hypothetical protein